MCGITGFITDFNYQKDNSINNLKQMINSIGHRGPDSSGHWIYQDSLYFGHTRLSIQDLTINGSQPMLSNNGQYCIIFNGEIYNHINLKKELDYNWKSSTDTETILALFQKYGVINTFKKLEGMFALACFDIFNKKLYLTRDSAGEKPLYFGWSNNVFLFSSELKSINSNTFFKKKLNIDAVNSLIQYSYIKTPLTIYQNIYKLSPGHIFECSLDIFKVKNVNQSNLYDKNNSYKISNFKNDIADKTTNKSNNSLLENIEEFSEIFTKTINSFFLSDVPVGVFLSGGIDSTITSLFAKKYTPHNFDSFSVGFENSEFDESLHASEVSSFLGIKNHKLILTSKDMQNVIPLIPKIYDEPFSDSSQIPTFLLSKLASNSVKVVLSGDGGDELFGGYNRYFKTDKMWNIIRFIPYKLRKFVSNLLLNNSNLFSILFFFTNKYKNLELSEEKFIKILQKISIIKDKKTTYLSMLKEVNDLQIDNFNLTSDFDIIFDSYVKKSLNFKESMMSYDFDTYLNDDILVKVDRASMANSLEVRAPFLDKKIINFSKKLPINHKIVNGKGKHILREILNKNIPKKIMDRPKMGFGIPLRDWLSNDLNIWMKDVLSIENLNKHNLFDNKKILNMTNNIEKTSINKLWSLLVFQTWFEDNF